LSAIPRSDRTHVFEAGIDRPATANLAAFHVGVAADRARPGKKRLKTWQIPAGWLCSIIGTCLTPADVDRIVRRCGVSLPDGAQAYDIHGFMVGRASEEGRVAREIGKALDEKHAANLRKVGAEQDQARLAALWNDLCGRGMVAGAYWAIMSHAHVAEALKVHAFGEVHMLSHFMGGCNRHNAKELWIAQRRADRLADRLARSRRQNEETIAARDRRISELERELSKMHHELAEAHQGRAGQGPAAAFAGAPRRRAAERGGRRLAAARARVNALEAENQRLQAVLGVLIDGARPRPAMAPGPSPIRRDAAESARQLDGSCILYVGGRCQLLPHLRARAASCNACLLHHDGGQEESLQSLGRLVDRADVVLCPIDCVSHQACLKVKALCRRRAKPFVPLRSSSATCFARAIEALQKPPIDRSKLELRQPAA
jgi:Uncharacterized protein conserved in bacteria (DUF2325)